MDRWGWVMYVWKEITPALACYLVNANWPWYPASDRDRWGRIVGLQWCNISVPIHVHVHTQTQCTSAQINWFMWMHVDVFINPPNLSTMANLGFVPQMTLMHQMDCSAWVASHSGAIGQIHTWHSFVFNLSFDQIIGHGFTEGTSGFWIHFTTLYPVSNRV